MDATSRSPRFLTTRLGRAIAFAALVWGVAASFIAFELLLQGGLELILARPALAPSLALSRATREAKTCSVGPANRAAGPRSPVSSGEARFRAWLLGLKLGRDALARQYPSVDRDLLARARADAEALALGLSVPLWPVFTPRRTIETNTEFLGFVEADPGSTARQLAAVHQPSACHLYKLGALWGYATLVRSSLPGERALFGPELRHHALEAGLPAALWMPMVEGAPRGATASEIDKGSAAITQRVSEALARIP
jgi:hypothetical protein